MSAINCVDYITPNPCNDVEFDEILQRNILQFKGANSITMEYTFCNVKEGRYSAAVRMKVSQSTLVYITSITAYVKEKEYLSKYINLNRNEWSRIRNFLQNSDKSSKLQISKSCVVEDYDKETGWFNIRLSELNVPKGCDVNWQYAEDSPSSSKENDIRWDYVELMQLIDIS